MAVSPTTAAAPLVARTLIAEAAEARQQATELGEPVE
jgi:hypothetical protein